MRTAAAKSVPHASTPPATINWLPSCDTAIDAKARGLGPSLRGVRVVAVSKLAVKQREHQV